MTLQPPQPSVAILGTRGYPSYYGGFETAVRKLAPYLADQGWDVTVYGRRGGTREDDPELDTRVNRVVTRGAQSKSLSTLTYGFWSAVHAWRSKPDVVLVMNVANGFWLPLLKWRGIPAVVNVDGIEWERGKWGRLARTIFRWGARLTARYAAGIVVDSHEIGRYWREKFGREGEYIPYGGDVPGRLPLEPGLGKGAYILLVARFVPENTIAEFFHAVETLADRYDVVLVGSTGFGGEFDDHARMLDERFRRVRWLGHVNDDLRLLALWQHAGVYFHGHSVGGTNPALVQAMACGAPIVARDTVFNREVLGDAGRFSGADAESIAEVITSLIADRDARLHLSRAASIRAVEGFSWASVNDSYSRILSGAVSSVRK